jgi:hypothetical protein
VSCSTTTTASSTLGFGVGVPALAGFARLKAELQPQIQALTRHYVVRKGLKAPHVEAFATKVRPEGGGGDGGPNSGGFDQFGYGTLTFTLK